MFQLNFCFVNIYYLYPVHKKIKLLNFDVSRPPLMWPSVQMVKNFLRHSRIICTATADKLYSKTMSRLTLDWSLTKMFLQVCWLLPSMARLMELSNLWRKNGSSSLFLWWSGRMFFTQLPLGGSLIRMPYLIMFSYFLWWTISDNPQHLLVTIGDEPHWKSGR